MKNNLKRFLSLFLCISFLFGMIPAHCLNRFDGLNSLGMEACALENNMKPVGRIYAPQTVTHPAETVSIPIYVVDNPGFAGFAITLK